MQASLAHLLASQASLSELGGLSLASCRPAPPHGKAAQPAQPLHHMQSVHYSLARRKQRLSSGPQFLLGRDDSLPVSQLMPPWTAAAPTAMTHSGHAAPQADALHKTPPVHALSSNRRLLSTFGFGVDYGYCGHSERGYRDHIQSQGGGING